MKAFRTNKLLFNHLQFKLNTPLSKSFFGTSNFQAFKVKYNESINEFRNKLYFLLKQIKNRRKIHRRPKKAETKHKCLCSSFR